MSTDPGPIPLQDDRTFRRVLAFFALILGVLAFIVAVSLRNLSRSVATSDWVNHTHALINELDALQPTLQAAEGDLSRFLLTNDSRDQASYQAKFAELGERVDVIHALTNRAPEEQALFTPVAALLEHRARLATDLAVHKGRGEQETWQKLLAEDAARGELHELGRLVERCREFQTNLLSARDRTSFQQAQTTRWTVIGGLGFNVLLLLGATWLIRDDLAARRRAARLLQASNDELEEKVRQRTAELSASNEKLLARNIEDRWAKQALEHQNRYNLLIIDSVADSVFVVTRLLNVSRMNPAAVHLTGHEPSGLIDKPLATFLHPADTATALSFDPLARALAEGHELRDRAATVRTKGGQSVSVRLNLYPLRDRDKVVGGVVILQSLAPASL